MHATDTTLPDARHAVADEAAWTDARLALLAREKQLMRLHDRIAAERRALPWRRIDVARYVFDTPEGPRTLDQLFDGHRQLLVQHFMLGADWDAGCPSCSYMADHTDGMLPHLAARDTAFVAISRAPLDRIEAFQRRMGWGFRWVSSAGNRFNRDFHVSFDDEDRVGGEVLYNYHRTDFPSSEAPGISAFVRSDAGEVFLTYSTFGRGVEAMMGTYAMLDLTAFGRHEREDAPNKMEWVRHHDRYPQGVPAATAGGACCHDKA